MQLQILKPNFYFFITAFAIGLLLQNTQPASAQTIDSKFLKGFKPIGRIAPRHAKDITSSNWSIGAETMDRNYTIYKNWKEFLGPLGFKKARVQAGWARTENQKAVYDWNWLDEIIFDMPLHGVTPWVNLGYGNSVYADGGGTTLFGKVPESPEALNAWDQWVKAMVARYKDVVTEWEIWNEPNYKVPAKQYADFLIRTAQKVKEIQPKGKILAFGLGSGADYEYADDVLQLVAAQKKLHLIDQVTFHRHQFVPEDYDNVKKLQEVVNRYDPRIEIRQTESGAPTARQKTKALSNYDWNEYIASKWALRRLLGDLGRDIESSYFSIMEMKYPDEMNTKGILKSGDDQTVERQKKVYFVLQHVASVFDHSLQRLPDYQYEVKTDSAFSLFTYQHKDSKEQLLTIWLHNGIPKNENKAIQLDLKLNDAAFSNPVYVDMMSGAIYSIPAKNIKRSGNTITFNNIPVYDSPILLADESLIPIRGQEQNE